MILMGGYIYIVKVSIVSIFGAFMLVIISLAIQNEQNFFQNCNYKFIEL